MSPEPRPKVVEVVAANFAALRAAGVPRRFAEQAAAVLAALAFSADVQSGRPQTSPAARSLSIERLGDFLEAACIITGDEADEERATNMFAAYAAWCEDARVEPMSQTAFGRQLGARQGIRKVRSCGTWYIGIRVVDRALLGDGPRKAEAS